ncbi:Uncharacterised protein [Mycobacteroides abscessus subsp. abscessus]|uniref:hypothetical protein n=1 Tax=Mycobacteroides abscessus TaxID=36809 RepID=UPI00092A59CD|nr:hypothetical protein [Mycobacteroides abscessus]SHT83889.1 Uncharacterised protein [Mycobacteroides abscessus subsp. abscessus]SKO52095.1 Uncharacterised protein [Mycobacteroides abscessus subsp. abscessus]
MAENDGWRTIQVAPVAPGLFVGAFPVVAVLLQEFVNNPKETRVVMAFPNSGDGVLEPWEKVHGHIEWSDAWNRPNNQD